MIAVWLATLAALSILGLTGSISVFRLARRRLLGPNSTARVGEGVVVVMNGRSLVPPSHKRILNLVKER